jgi:mycothiol S-conjugate amidase
VHTVLVCCTGGEEGDILNPSMDTPAVRADLAGVRRRELKTAASVIGYDEVVMLGYRDSGMPDTPANARPDCFARVPLAEAVGALVRVIRRVRPQVIVTYPEDQSSYPHPDHLRVREVSVAAFDAAGDRDAYPGGGLPWQPTKLYATGWSGARMLAMHEKFHELGLESPFDDEWLARAASHRHPHTTVIDVSASTDVRRLALLAHETQVDPTSRHWFGLPPEVAREVHPVDEYLLERDLGAETGSRVPSDGADRIPWEDDLFAGVRTTRTVARLDH